MNSHLQSLTIPDLWQQHAVRALRDGRDVVVHAPTGAGKTYIFELFQASLRGQAVFTVPTRALANDKLAEWQARGWDVGIATGDLALRLDAKIVVATLETQKGRLLDRGGPGLLVIDEYQMIADPARGVNYELAIALAPPGTQLLLLSGSVANPHEVVEWLTRIGRDAVLVSHEERPVPLQEVNLETLPARAPASIRGPWPRVIANAIHADLGPILLFAPRRHAAEELAGQLAAALPPAESLSLTLEQKHLAGSQLGKLLSRRVAFHHSGLSYAQRAGLIEPLAKAGQLRVVVATMGLAAGINFSMRSVAITGTSYMAGPFEREVRPDELLQMFGRAGRRGLDETGYALVTARPPRLHDARARALRRAAPVDWPTLIAVMEAAARRGEEPFAAAVALNDRLFSTSRIALGVEHSFATGAMPCGLWVDMERARFARKGVVEMLNSRGEWEERPATQTSTPLGKAMVWTNTEAARGKVQSAGSPDASPAPDPRQPEARLGRWQPALSVTRTLHGIGVGNFCKVGGDAVYGRELPLGVRREGTLVLAPWLRRALQITRIEPAAVEEKVLSKIPELTGGGRLTALFPRGEQLIAQVTYADRPTLAWIDSHGEALLDPPERRELPLPCRSCAELPWCQGAAITESPAFAWRHLGLIDRSGQPTRRGLIFSFFQHGEGLAVAAALEDAGYAVRDLLFDLANLRGGPRFAGEESLFAGRLAICCQQTYGRTDVEGYLAMGAPSDYAAGASHAVREIVEHGIAKQKLQSETLRLGDIERALVEWRSLLRHITKAPSHDWERWNDLKSVAAELLAQTERLATQVI